MDLASTSITMDRTAARKAFLEYRRAVRDNHQKQDVEIMRGYRQLARGTQLIDLPATIRAGGTTTISVPAASWARDKTPCAVNVPRLAFVRGGSPYCWTYGIGGTGRCDLQGRRELSPRNQRDRITITDLIPGKRDVAAMLRIRAMAPLIPPLLRPADKVENYHILWEAEWALDPTPPVDPALLKHVGGSLYAVVAVWELTDLERAVLAQP